MAVIAADNVLQDALDSSDVYSYDARMWFQLPPGFDVKKLNPKARKASKIIHLGRQYGAGLKTVFGQALRQDRSFTLSRTRLLMQQFDKGYYRTVRYWQEEMARVGVRLLRVTHHGSEALVPQAPRPLGGGELPGAEHGC